MNSSTHRLAGSQAPTRRQRTIAREATVTGLGLFSSAEVTLRFVPAPENHGIAFQRSDVSENTRIPALIDFVVSRPRRTALCRDGVTVETIEHVMAALAGLQIDNCLVTLDAPEPPAGDGSAQPFVDVLLDAGFVEQAATRPVLVVTNKVHVFEMDQSAEMLVHPSPDGTFQITYELDYGHPQDRHSRAGGNPDSERVRDSLDSRLRGNDGGVHQVLHSHIPAQSVTTSVSPDLFVDKISFARTFVLEEEVAALQAQGYGTRMTPQNLLVFGPDGPIDNRLHVEDECARHKLLDCIGDLALLGCDLCGAVTARRSGHRHNQEIVRDLLMTHPEIRAQIESTHTESLRATSQTTAA